MAGISISIGRESSVDELRAVKEAFQSDVLNIPVDANYVRMSRGDLPMTIMVWVAQGLAPNILWDTIKYAYKKIISDKRLNSRPRQAHIVVKRGNYDVVLGKDLIRAQSFEEIITFNSIEELIKYDEARIKSEKNNAKS